MIFELKLVEALVIVLIEPFVAKKIGGHKLNVHTVEADIFVRSKFHCFIPLAFNFVLS